MVILLKNDNLNVNKIDNIFTENAMHTIQYNFVQILQLSNKNANAANHS